MRDPSPEGVKANLHLISHPVDVPIVLAAMLAKVAYLVTLNRVHFIGDQDMAIRIGLYIGTPGNAINWVRGQISGEEQ